MLQMLLPVLHGVDASSLKIGVPCDFCIDNLDPEVDRVMNNVITKLSASGITLIEQRLPNVGEINRQVGFPIVLYEAGQSIPQYLQQNNTGVTMEELFNKIASPDVKEIMDQVMDVTDSVYREALEIYRPKLQKAFSDYMKLMPLYFPPLHCQQNQLRKPKTW